MLIFHLSQSANSEYDTYDSCVVIAPDEDTARCISPEYGWENNTLRANIEQDCWEEWTWTDSANCKKDWAIRSGSSTWALPSQITVTLIGVALPDAVPGVVCSSFNAG